MPPHPLTNFEIQKYYQNYAQQSSKNETRFNGVYSRDNLPDNFSDIGIHWVVLYINNNDVTYFDSFGVENITNELKHLLVIKT